MYVCELCRFCEGIQSAAVDVRDLMKMQDDAQRKDSKDW